MHRKEEGLEGNFEVVRGPLRFPGGKTRAVRKILALMPDFKEYREPMVGGASVFLSVKNRFPNRSFWISDFNHDLIAFWNACRDIPESLSKEAHKVKESGKSGKEVFVEWSKPIYPLTDFERGLRFYILNRISFSGLVDAGGYSKESYFRRFTTKSIGRINEVSRYLVGTKVTHSSYELLVREPGDDVFIYLDPPYFENKASKLYGKKGELHVTFNHERLRRELYNCSYNWLLTYDDSKTIRKYYSFANIYEGEISYGMNNGGRHQEAPKKNELFICNYDLKQRTLNTYGLSQT